MNKSLSGIRKRLCKRWERWRNRLLTRCFDSRMGRRLLIENIGSRVLSMTVDAGDHRLTFSPADYIGRKVFRKGHFDRDRVDRLLVVLRERGLSRRDSVLLELGGNIGTQTVYFALSGAFSRIVSVEPDPRNFALLARNIRDNGLDEEVTLVNVAAGDSEGEIDFFLDPTNHGKSSALKTGAKAVRVKVPARPVTAILSDLGIEESEIGLVWMDIEGFEPMACRSMQGLLARRVPLYMEFTPLFYGPEGTRAFIAALAQHYRRCLVVFEGEEEERDVVDLPTDIDQCDVLFLP